MTWVLLFQVSLEPWIRRLGDEDYAVREAAHAYWDNLGAAAESTLRRHAGSPDPEIATRVGMLLQGIEGDRGSLYFVRQRDLVACSPDGIDFRLIAKDVGPLFALSPDRRKIAYTHKEGIWLARADGVDAHATNVCRANEWAAWEPAAMLWATDGQTVLFKLLEDPKEGTRRCGLWEPEILVKRMTVETEETESLGSSFVRWERIRRRHTDFTSEDLAAFNEAGGGGPPAPVYSPGGRRVAFLDGTDVYSGNANGTGFALIARDGVPTSSLYWSPHR